MPWPWLLTCLNGDHHTLYRLHVWTKTRKRWDDRDDNKIHNKMMTIMTTWIILSQKSSSTNNNSNVQRTCLTQNSISKFSYYTGVFLQLVKWPKAPNNHQRHRSQMNLILTNIHWERLARKCSQLHSYSIIENCLKVLTEWWNPSVSMTRLPLGCYKPHTYTQTYTASLPHTFRHRGLHKPTPANGRTGKIDWPNTHAEQAVSESACYSDR